MCVLFLGNSRRPSDQSPSDRKGILARRTQPPPLPSEVVCVCCVCVWGCVCVCVCVCVGYCAFMPINNTAKHQEVLYREDASQEGKCLQNREKEKEKEREREGERKRERGREREGEKESTERER